LIWIHPQNRSFHNCSANFPEEYLRKISYPRKYLGEILRKVSRMCLNYGQKILPVTSPRNQSTATLHTAHVLTTTTRNKVIWQKAELLWQVNPTPCLYSPDGSVRLTVWLQFGLGFDPQMSSSSGGSGTPIEHKVSLDRRSVPAKCHLNPSNDSSREHKCDRRQTDRQTTLWRNVWEQAESLVLQERFHLKTTKSQKTIKIASPPTEC